MGARGMSAREGGVMGRGGEAERTKEKGKICITL